MKLRIKGNSIRLRLTQSEVSSLQNTGQVQETCDFGHGNRFRYTVDSSANSQHLRATLNASSITVSLPSAKIETWAAGSDVGIYGASGPLEIAVEKDFRCISRPANADETDAFPNPTVTCGSDSSH